MRRHVLISLFSIAAGLLVGCGKQRSTEGITNQQNIPTKVDACALLTPEEIQTVQRSPVKFTASERRGGGLRISQCYYAAAESGKSVVVEVTQTDDSASKRNPKEL